MQVFSHVWWLGHCTQWHDDVEAPLGDKRLVGVSLFMAWNKINKKHMKTKQTHTQNEECHGGWTKVFFFLSSFFVKGVQKWYCKEGRSSPHPYCRRRHVKQGSNICVSIYNVLAPLPCVNIDFYIYSLLFGHRLKHIRLQNKRLKIMIVLECVWNSNTLRLRATSHTRPRALDRCTSSTPVGERGRAGASSLRTKLYRPTE